MLQIIKNIYATLMKETILYVGIDPSINSTGITIARYENNVEVEIKFYIIKNGKLTKRESAANDSIDNFEYIIYNKIDLTQFKDDNHVFEYYKTKNMVEVVNTIYDLILNEVKKYTSVVNVVIEGISYGSSIRTKSIFDLAGLNYMIRYKLITSDIQHLNLSIATPSNIKKYATGKGNANKESIMTIFKYIFPEMQNIPKLDDIADSYFMAMFSRDIECKNTEK